MGELTILVGHDRRNPRRLRSKARRRIWKGPAMRSQVANRLLPNHVSALRIRSREYLRSRQCSGKQAEYALAQTVPVSLTGLLAVLKYEREFSERGDTLFAGDTLANFFEATETAIRNQLASA